ncbi:MAG: PRC-barrel domain-containing protein [Candidatus Promineifilaceae bacterium]|nr:PRC-barrel domain-containing protein [Candidatus Promineifilaceae bacterium]
MRYGRWKRWLLLVLVMALGLMALTACDADEDEVGEADAGLAEADIEDADELLDENDVDVEEEELVEGVLEDDELTDEELAEEVDLVATTPGMVQIENLTGLPVIDTDGETVGITGNFLFSTDGRIHLVVFQTLDNAFVAVNPEAVEPAFEGEAGEWALMLTEADPAMAAIGPALLDQNEIFATELETVEMILEPGLLTLDETFMWAEDFIAFELFTEDGESPGEIEQILVDIVDWELAYGIVDVGGFLGIGEKQVPIPWTAFEYAPQSGAFVLPVDAETLENAPEINLASEVAPGAVDFGTDLEDLGVPEFWEAELES